MIKRFLIIFCAITCVIPLLQGQITGVDRYGNDCQTDCFFVNQYGGDCSQARLNRFGHLLGYPPTVTTDSAQLHGMDSISVFGTVVDDGFANVTSRGFQYANHESFVNGTNIIIGSGLGSFHGQITNLSPNQTYYYRSFANNQYGRKYGNTLSIQTEIGDLVLGEVSRGVASDYFNIRIPILNNGGAPVSGQVCAYTDTAHTELFSCQEISPTTYSAHTSYFTNAIPGTVYYIEALVTNTKDTIILHTQVACPTDLTVRVYHGDPAMTYGCDPPEGKDYHFYVSISGEDPRKNQAEILWNYSAGTGTMNDTNLVIHIEEDLTLAVTASIVVGNDTIAATNTLSLTVTNALRTQTTCSCCSEEFINTVSCSGNAAAYCWVNENNDTVANTASVTLPTGDYTLWYTDRYGCSVSKPVHVGPKVRHCVIEGEPRPSESAHLENGVWVLDSIQDHQGNWYIIKQFDSQCWMRQSMRCTHTPSGTDLIVTNERIRAQYYENVYDPEGSKQYGLRYTWLAALDTDYNTLYSINLGDYWRGICPEGWHIPRWEECITLTEYVIHQKDPTLVISPAPNPENRLIGSNIPVPGWLTHSCSFGASDSDWSEFSMMQGGPYSAFSASYSILVTNNFGNNRAQVFNAKRGQNGVSLQSYGYNEAVPVKCIRNP
jgi:uncharacterized protein (TIGR02145 family)